MIQIEAKSDEKPQFTSVNEDFEEDFNEELDQKMSFAKLSNDDLKEIDYIFNRLK